ncbi:LuxR family transcriptional regulator [Mycobacterium sp. 236(2023)]|uniref:LuxR family transcriptional regulator n=1 Tax=Mycobacterium sp. 236(2023) TaxID=3038163 RepID=UPI0024157C6B|nr:LuxR family transcriptional regulator [Mycobacterium sp. 236(2023)]MDG4667095.1 AAA family ATPase [Mycobacterium sp. 236(2023)]
MNALPGRAAECQILQGVLTGIRSGSGEVTVLLGEAGIGKTALLDHLTESASDCLVLRATGIESDMELAYAGLQQLCAPILEYRHSLPRPQQAAIGSAFGLDDMTPAPDRFLVGLAVLGLLAAASQDQPVLCIVDDLQWFDSVSAQTLLFVARRLVAERVGLVFAMRTPIEGIAGLPAIAVSGLAPDYARELLESAFPGRLDPTVRDRIVAESRGNPLALLAIPRGLSAIELAGGYQRPDHRPVAADIDDHYRATLESLPSDTRRALLLAASEPLGDPALLRAAMERMGIPPNALTPAVDAGLVSVDTRVQFHHPLARSSAYRTAPLAERRAAHAALADSTDPVTDPDRKAWHRALAVEGVDEPAAHELEASARRARLRGGTAAAAAFLTRAVELTPDPATRGTRALAAAEAHREVASFDIAHDLLAAAELAPLTDLEKARLAQLKTRLAFAGARANGDADALIDSVDEFAAIAAQLERIDHGMATESYLEAMSAAMYVGRRAGSRAAEIAVAARAAFAGKPPTRPLDEVTHAVADRLALGPAAAMPAMRAALDSLKRAGRDTAAGHGHEWFWLAFPIVHESLVHEAWDDDGWEVISQSATRIATDRGALTLLPAALLSRAGAQMEKGELASAKAYVAEANDISIATGYTPLKYHRMVLTAWCGEEVEATRLIASALKDGARRGEGRIAGLAHYAATILNNGAARYPAARDAGRLAAEYEDLGFISELLLELVEAAARAGDEATAAEALDRLEERTLASGTHRALGSLARARALVADGEGAEDFFLAAITHFEQTSQAIQHARTRLLYGEWLRRNRAAARSREHLKYAHEALLRMGSRAFAERARKELIAAGAKTRKQPARPGEQLSPQELQIAQLVSQGLTNQEIAGQLFLSAHTVEYHLRKVFPKLGIRSRRELRSKLAAGSP